MKKNNLIIIRGGGDLATGVIQKFHRSGFQVLVLEIAQPRAIRRSVALSEAIYQGSMHVEDLHAKPIACLQELEKSFSQEIIPIFVDPQAHCIAQLQPQAVIDATLAKRNLGMHLAMAPITIALGPGCTAGKDVHAVIETMRGHDLGRLILQGEAMANTGIPGEIGGKSHQRVIHAPASGYLHAKHQIGDLVEEAEIFGYVGDHPLIAPFRGILRGLIAEGVAIPQGMKIADIDPRLDVDWQTISDKARALGGACLEAYFYLRERNKGV